MVTIPPCHYAIIDDPVIKDKDGNIVTDELGQARVRLGNQEVRLTQQPFVLYPGEKCGKIEPLQVVEDSQALCLKAKRDFKDKYENKERKAGEEWLFIGPGVYLPQVEIQVLSVVKSVILKDNQAIKVQALNDCVDHLGQERKAGEEWLVKTPGAYLPGPQEKLSSIINAHILDTETGLYIRAKKTFVDERGNRHKAGEEWLVTREDTEAHIPGIYEEVFSTVKRIFLDKDEYCIVLDPRSKTTGKIQLGTKELRKGEQVSNFFLFPGESLHPSGKQKASIIFPNVCFHLKAKEEFKDEWNARHKPGAEFYVYGPRKYIIPMEAELQRQSTAVLPIPSLGIYIFTPAYLVVLVIGFLYLLLRMFQA